MSDDAGPQVHALLYCERIPTSLQALLLQQPFVSVSVSMSYTRSSFGVPSYLSTPLVWYVY